MILANASAIGMEPNSDQTPVSKVLSPSLYSVKHILIIIFVEIYGEYKFLGTLVSDIYVHHELSRGLYCAMFNTENIYSNNSDLMSCLFRRP